MKVITFISTLLAATGASLAAESPSDARPLLDVVRRYCSLKGVELRATADGLTNRRSQNGT